MTQLALAYGLGMLALVNPCGFMMLPAFFAYNLSDSDAGGRTVSRLGRGVWAGLLVSIGFAGTFFTAGLVVALGLRSVTESVPWFSVVIGAGLIIVGLAMLAGRRVALNLKTKTTPRQSAPTGGGRRLVGFGGAYGLTQLACGMGSLLALVGTGVAAGSSFGTTTVFLAFGLGSTSMLVMLAASTALMSDVLVRTIRGALPAVSRISGGVLALTGAYLIVYWAPALNGGSSSNTWASRLVHEWSASTRHFVGAHEIALTVLALVVAALSVVALRHTSPTVESSTGEKAQQDEDALTS